MPTFENPRQTLVDLFQVAVQRAMPLHTLGAHLPPPPPPGGRTVVLGAGKAGAAMALALFMALAASYHLRKKEYKPIGVNLILLVLLLIVGSIYDITPHYGAAVKKWKPSRPACWRHEYLIKLCTG